MAAHPGATENRPLGGLLRVLAAAAALGTLGPVAVVAYGRGVEPATFSALRAGIGAAILGALVLSRRQPSVSLGTLAPRQQALLALAVAANGLMNLTLFFGFGAMAVGLVMTIFYCYPVLVALMSAALGRERLAAVRMIALAFAGAGLALVLGSRLGPGAQATAAGVALAGIAATCHAVYLVAIRGGFDEVPAVQATSLVLVGGLAISGTAALVIEGVGGAGDWFVSPIAWAAIVCAGTLGAALPKVWVIGGVRLIGSTRVAVAMLMEPVVAVAVSAVVLGQRLSGLELAGGAAILVAVVLAQLPPRTSPGSVSAAVS
ncbi:MAG TPA: DMT family transporter [Candidatus Sulfomarinibacteraceae bacterium]|nr:DMT family transporter [Candidatus Sulfomarinibacteraceae bacterium]